MELRLIISAIVSICSFIYLLVKKKGKLLWISIFSIVLFPLMLLVSKGIQMAYLEENIIVGLHAIENIVINYYGIYLYVIVLFIVSVDQLFINKKNKDGVTTKLFIKRTIVTKSFVNGNEVTSKKIVDEKVIDSPPVINKCTHCGIEIPKEKYVCDDCFIKIQDKNHNTNIKIIMAVYLAIYVGLFLFFCSTSTFATSISLGHAASHPTLWEYLTRNIPLAFFFSSIPCFVAVIYSYKIKKMNYFLFNLIFFISNLIFYFIYIE